MSLPPANLAVLLIPRNAFKKRPTSVEIAGLQYTALAASLMTYPRRT